MNDLWIIAILGGGAGAAVGGPLVFRRRDERESWTTERLAGLWLLGGALAMVLVGLRHGGLFAPSWDLAVEHLTDTLSIVSWTTLVTLTYRIAGIELRWPVSVADHLVLPLGYVTIIAALGFPDLRFLWLLPVTAVGCLAIAAVWWRVRRTAAPDVVSQVNAVLLFALVFAASQAVRSFFPRVLELREIVPIAMTVSFFAIGFALSGRTIPTAPSYKKSGLTRDRARELVARLDDDMVAHALFRDASLSLGALADRLDVSPQTLSQALNQERRQTLTEYLTELRVRDAKARLTDPGHDCYTVEGIARQSGYASRSAFYKAFRDAEGVTPTEYRRRVRA